MQPGSFPPAPPERQPDSPLVSLPARLWLLSLDGAGRPDGRDRRSMAMVAAALAELQFAGCLLDDRGLLRPSGHRNISDPVLGALLVRLADGKPRSWGHWISGYSGWMERAVRDQLVHDGRVRRAGRGPLMLGRARWRPTDPDELGMLRGRVRAVLLGDMPLPRVDAGDGTLAVLAARCPLTVLLTRSEAVQAAGRVAELMSRSAAAQALDAAANQADVLVVGQATHLYGPPPGT